MNEQQLHALPPVDTSGWSPAESGRPAGESPAAAKENESQANQAVEKSPSGFTDPSAGMPPIMPLPPAPLADPATAAASNTPAIADDIDLIEKEWVDKAKHIVEQTKHDPYQQNEEMTKMKADYLKKRYNRDIKVGKD